MEKKYGAFSSSVDPSQLSKRVEGALIAVSAAVLWIAAHFGFMLSSDQYVQAVSNITQIVLCVASVIGPLMSFYGLLRSVFVKKVATPSA